MEFTLGAVAAFITILWFAHAVRRELANHRSHELELKQLDVQQSADDRATAEATLQIKQLEAKTAEDNRLAAEAALDRDPRPFSWS
jgi:hypothetical protein